MLRLKKTKKGYKKNSRHRSLEKSFLLYLVLLNTNLMFRFPKAEQSWKSDIFNACNTVDNSTKKPEMISYCNYTRRRSGWNRQKNSIYTCCWRTRRWLKFWTYVASWVFPYIQHQTKKNRKRRFSKEITLILGCLVEPHKRRRTANQTLPKELNMTLKGVFGADKPPEELPTQNDPSKKKKCTWTLTTKTKKES